MELETLNAVHLQVKFPDRNLAKPVLLELSLDPSVSVNILCGRVTEKEAWFDVEVRGSAPRVAELVRLTRRWGADVRSDGKEIAYAS